MTGSSRHERQVAAVRRDHPHIPPGQRGHLPESAAPLRRRRGRQLRPVGRLRRPRPLAQHVLRVGGRRGELGGPVPVRVAFEVLEHLGPASLAEVAESFLGRAVESDPPAGDEDQQPVTGVQVVDAVRDDDDRPAVMGQVPHLFHDRFVQARVETRGRLVEEQQRRLGQQLLRDVDPLELPAGQPVRARLGVLGQAELAHHLIDPAVPLGGLGVGGKAELGRVLQRPARGQLGVQDALLRDQADAVAELVVVRIQVAVVVEHGAGVRGTHSGQRAEQRGLTRATWPDDAQQAFLRDRERHAVEQDLAAPDLHDQVLGGEGDIALVDELPELAVLEPERGVPDADEVLFGQHLGGNPLAVDKGAVMATEVDNLVAAGGRFAQFRVVARDVDIGKDHVVVGYAADAQGLGRQRHPRRGPAVHARQQVRRDRLGWLGAAPWRAEERARARGHAAGRARAARCGHAARRARAVRLLGRAGPAARERPTGPCPDGRPGGRRPGRPRVRAPGARSAGPGRRPGCPAAPRTRR